MLSMAEHRRHERDLRRSSMRTLSAPDIGCPHPPGHRIYPLDYFQLPSLFDHSTVGKIVRRLDEYIL